MRRLKKILKWTGIVLAALVAIGLVANAWFVWSTDRRLEGQLAAIRAAGEPLTLAELAPKPIPPEQNAATYLRQAEAGLGAIEGAVWVGDWCRGWGEGHRISPEGAKLVKAAFDAHPHVVRCWNKRPRVRTVTPSWTARAGSRRSRWRFSTCSTTIMNANASWSCAYLLATEGKYDEAVRTSLQLMRLADHFQRDWYLLGTMTAVSSRLCAIGAANSALQAGSVSKEVREALDAELAELDRLELGDCLRRAIRSERAYGIALMALVRSPQFLARRSGILEPKRVSIPGRMAKAAPTAGRDGHLPAGRAHCQRRLLGLLLGRVGNGQAWRFLGALRAVITIFTDSQGTVRSLRVLNALQTHVPPGSDKVPKLSELGLPAETTVNPFSGEPLHVKKNPARMARLFRRPEFPRRRREAGRPSQRRRWRWPAASDRQARQGIGASGTCPRQAWAWHRSVGTRSVPDTFTPPACRPRVVQAEEHGEIVAEVAGQQEVLADEALADLAHPLPLVGVA